jgi:hypothetical protein
MDITALSSLLAIVLGFVFLLISLDHNRQHALGHGILGLLMLATGFLNLLLNVLPQPTF